jgi:hypothetical protein
MDRRPEREMVAYMRVTTGMIAGVASRDDLLLS